jgi:hypothetical protein
VAPPGWLIGAALLFALFLTLPRLPYVLEWIPGNAVLAQADDWGRLSELVSMTLSERYPLQHFANQDYLLSHYYTALYPMAFLKMLLPMLMLKDVILAGNALYHLLLVLSLLEIAFRLLPSLRSAAVFFFLCTLFGGFDWVLEAGVPFSHAELWPRSIFGANREISSYFTGVYWVAHHFTAFHALTMALVFARQLRFRRRAVKIGLLGLLVINAFYSSVFAFLPALLLGGTELLRLARQAWRTRVLPALAAVFLTPLFLYTNRVQAGALSFEPLRLRLFEPGWLDAAASSVAYLLLAALVDLAGVPLVLAAFWRRFGARERRRYVAALIFLCSTACVASIGYNNYSMRGMFLPTLVFYYLFAKYAVASLPRLRRPALAALAAVLAFGTLREWAWLTYQPLAYSYWYWEVRGRQPHPSVAGDLRRFYRDLARDRQARIYEPLAGDRFSRHKYNPEKLIRGIPPQEMLEPERELLRHPRRNWFW